MALLPDLLKLKLLNQVIHFSHRQEGFMQLEQEQYWLRSSRHQISLTEYLTGTGKVPAKKRGNCIPNWLLMQSTLVLQEKVKSGRNPN